MRRFFYFVLFVLFSSAIAAIAAGVTVLRPRLDEPTNADAIVVPSGDHGERLKAALALMRRDVAPTLVLVGAPDFPEAGAVCRGDLAFEVICLRPRPDPNTRGQAQAVTALAGSRAWRSLAVVTSIQHVTRARLLFDRCFDGDLEVMGVEPPPLIDISSSVEHEWFGYLHAVLLTKGC